MRRPMAKKVLAASLAAAMTMSLVACNKGGETSTSTSASTSTPASTSTVSTVEPDPEPYTVLTDKDGKPYDLGGMEILVRDWWSGDGAVAAPSTLFEEEQQAWREWIQKEYNFTIKQVGISDWGGAAADFQEYATTGGDENNYVFTIPDGMAAFSSAVNAGLAYDLATLDCLDFTQAKFVNNGLHKTWTFGNSIYAMTTGQSEPRTGIFFNKTVLKDAGIDPESIYDMAENGQWTWDAFESLMAKVQRDVDNDGTLDYFGMTLNEGDLYTAAIASNGGAYFAKEADGKFRYALEDDNTMEALVWANKIHTIYDNHDPEGANWDYYKEEFASGKIGFMIEGVYCGYGNGYLCDSFDSDTVGFVMFPQGPRGNMVNVYADNILCIPSCYDADRAWKIAFAWNLYTNDPEGFENAENGFITNCRNGVMDERAIKQVEMMMTPEHAYNMYHSQVPGVEMGPQFLWTFGVGADMSAVCAAVRDSWKGYVDAANAGK